MAKMTPLPQTAYSPVFPNDTRTKPPMVGDERTLLTAFLDYHRATVELKCLGVAAEKLNERTMPPSTMTLHGLIRHLAGAEHWWFHYQFAGEETRHLFDVTANPDADFEDLSGSFEEALETWRAMCEHSREIVARSSLDDTGTVERTGEPVSLRRILLHMIAEYARHSGHADFLREAIDGAVGQ
jgi:uncharacterized damage-inducible protein DinB